MRRHRKKKFVFGILSISCFLLASFLAANAAVSDSIPIKFTVQYQSRSPVFITWFDPDYLVPHMAAPQFWCRIYDIDNSSSELTVTLFMSKDNFSITNESYSMNYDSLHSENNYIFEYTWQPEPERTHYDYYYQCYDGNYTVKKPAEADVFFDIQWDLAGNPGVTTTTPYIEPEVTPPTTKVPLMTEENFTWLLILSGGGFILLFVYYEKEDKKEQSPYFKK